MIDWTHLASLSIASGILLLLGNWLLLKSDRFSDGSLPFDESWPEQLRSKGVIRVVVESAIVFVVLSGLGLFLAGLAGVTALQSFSDEHSVMPRILRIAALGVGFGIVCGAVFEALRVFLFFPDLKKWNEDCRFSRWRTFCGAAICAGIFEELVFRLILLSALAWAFGFLWRADDGTPASLAFWTANLVVSFLMAVVHIPLAGFAVPRTTVNAIKVLVLVTIVSLLLGYVYWFFGFEIVVLCHASALLFSWLVTSAFE